MDEARARKRREQWSGGVARTFVELEALDLDAWARVDPSERLGMVFDLWDEQMSLRDPAHEASARLERSVGGVRRRRR